MSTQRVSVTLDTPDQQAIEPFEDPSRAEHATLEAWAAAHGMSIRDGSGAAILRMLARAGAEALREQALEDGYARLAETRHESRTERRTARDRAVRRGERAGNE